MTAAAPPDGAWQKLHGLTPFVRSGRAGAPLIVLLLLSVSRHSSSSGSGGGGTASLVVWLVLIAVVLTGGTVSWLVTRWAFDGSTLKIDRGLIRRDSQRIPVTRIQAVDLLQPFLARTCGLAELRVRVAGARHASHLAYLSEPVAADLRARLLAAHHGVDPSVPEPPEQPVTAVPTGRLVGSVVLSGPALLVAAVIAGLGGLAAASPRVAAAVVSVLAVYLIGLGTAVWRRFNEQYGFVVALSPDGIRIRRGLLGTVAETVPIRRVQAVRQIEPLLWRLFGWCRLEVDLAGVPGRNRTSGTARITKSLLPVGSLAVSSQLREAVVGPGGPPLAPPPRRARAKAPLAYHFLSGGHDASLAVATTGRVRKVTCWVPLEKAQSVRRVQGPVQRALGLATVHVDVASKRIGAQFRDRSVEEADRLVEELAAHSRGARRRDRERAAATVARPAPPPSASGTGGPAGGPGLPPAGWYSDPAGRHRHRFWDGSAWSAHVADDGVTAVDPLGPPAPDESAASQ